MMMMNGGRVSCSYRRSTTGSGMRAAHLFGMQSHKNTSYTSFDRGLCLGQPRVNNQTTVLVCFPVNSNDATLTQGPIVTRGEGLVNL
jgi:hypothetical protein